MERILGFDYGEARIGVAGSDSLGMMAHPRATVPAKPIETAMRKLVELAKAEQATRLVVGLPRNMDGSFGPAATAARAFGEKLSAACGLPVEYWDERLTTVAAQKALHGAGKNTKQSRSVIDQVAAQILLQSYLDAKALQSELEQ